MSRVRIVIPTIVVFAATAAAAAPHPFYAHKLQRGVAHVQAGRFAEGARDLRVAAFGLLDEPAQYETAQIYIAIAAEKLGRVEESRLAAAKFLQAERVAPSYASLTLDANTRASFEKIVASAVEPEALASIPSFRRSSPKVVSEVASTTAQPQLPAAKPEVKQPEVKQPEVKQPEVKQPAVQQPAVQRPEVQHPAVQQPAIKQPEVKKAEPKPVPPPAVQTPAVQAPVKAQAAAPSPVARPQSPDPGLTAAQQLLNEGKLLAARAAFAELAQRKDLPRAQQLDVARGLNRCGAWQESAFVYQRAQPFRAGEEAHMFFEAVNRYELGELLVARTLLARALKGIPETREVALYRSRIESGL